jgi:predicted AAA+ superfamily ATPase
MITRQLKGKLLASLQQMPVVALLGPRQVGKTTLALAVADQIQKETTYLDLESDADWNKLSDAEAYLKRFDGKLLILDEVQRKPDIFRLLRGMVDDRKRRGERSAQFLLLGSASQELLQHSSETLAGRIRYLELTPFSIAELMDAPGGEYDLERRWLRGGFPDSYLAADDEASRLWREDFIATYLERDIPRLGIGIPAAQLRRFWKMLTHYHGNQANLSEIGRSMELSHTTTRRYLDLLSDLYMVRQVQPWSGNSKKRLVKTPKIYLRDTGILHNLLQVHSMESLLAYPAMGASWEGFVAEQILQHTDSRFDCSYYRSAAQAEIDIILKTPDGEVWAIEIKRSESAKPARGFYSACEEVGATHQWMVHGGKSQFPLPHGVEAIGLEAFIRLLQPWF